MSEVFVNANGADPFRYVSGEQPMGGDVVRLYRPRSLHWNVKHVTDEAHGAFMRLERPSRRRGVYAFDRPANHYILVKRAAYRGHAAIERQ